MNRSFQILLWILFLVVLLLSALFLIKAKTSTSLECQKKVLEKDSALGKIRNHQCEEISLSETIRNYVGALKELNFEECPTAFKQSFQLHMDAWTAMTEVTDEYSKLRGEMHDLFDLIKLEDSTGQFTKRLDAIWATWAEVENSMEE